MQPLRRLNLGATVWDMPPKDLISSSEARAVLMVSRSTLHRYVQRGLLTAYRTPGGQLRFSRADINAALSKTGKV
jgi:excisionase family DNA binding protein